MSLRALGLVLCPVLRVIVSPCLGAACSDLGFRVGRWLGQDR